MMCFSRQACHTVAHGLSLPGVNELHYTIGEQTHPGECEQAFSQMNHLRGCPASVLHQMSA